MLHWYEPRRVLRSAFKNMTWRVFFLYCLVTMNTTGGRTVIHRNTRSTDFRVSTIIACEGEKAFIKCPDVYHRAHILTTMFGRMNNGTCVTPYIPSNHTCEEQSASIKKIILSLCEGENRCEVAATNDFLASEDNIICPRVSKYLQIEYQCLPKAPVSFGLVQEPPKTESGSQRNEGVNNNNLKDELEVSSALLHEAIKKMAYDKTPPRDTDPNNAAKKNGVESSQSSRARHMQFHTDEQEQEQEEVTKNTNDGTSDDTSEFLQSEQSEPDMRTGSVPQQAFGQDKSMDLKDAIEVSSALFNEQPGGSLEKNLNDEESLLYRLNKQIESDDDEIDFVNNRSDTSSSNSKIPHSEDDDVIDLEMKEGKKSFDEEENNELDLASSDNVQDALADGVRDRIISKKLSGVGQATEKYIDDDDMRADDDDTIDINADHATASKSDAIETSRLSTLRHSMPSNENEKFHFHSEPPLEIRSYLAPNTLPQADDGMPSTMKRRSMFINNIDAVRRYSRDNGYDVMKSVMKASHGDSFEAIVDNSDLHA